MLDSFSRSRSTHALDFVLFYFPSSVTWKAMVCLVIFTLLNPLLLICPYGVGRTTKHSHRQQEVKTHPQWKNSIVNLNANVCFSWNTPSTVYQSWIPMNTYVLCLLPRTDIDCNILKMVGTMWLWVKEHSRCISQSRYHFCFPLKANLKIYFLAAV